MYPPPQTLPSEVADLRARRKALKITLTQMAILTDTSIQYLSEIESGKRPCSQAILNRYLKALEFPL